ncbi:MAG: hypothetical protein Q4C95_11150 [Planctomycetia bacterium]|nr:hypothetical protein [Planctomycetia bacterium]
MKKHSLFVFLFGFLFCFAIPVSIMAQTDKSVDADDDSCELAQSCFVNDPSKMLKNWLLLQIDQKQIEWQQRYESLKTIPEIEQYKQERIDFFWKQLGTLWDKTPLNPQITGTLEKDGYRVEKILFESLPQF